MQLWASLTHMVLTGLLNGNAYWTRQVGKFNEIIYTKRPQVQAQGRGEVNSHSLPKPRKIKKLQDCHALSKFMGIFVSEIRKS